MRITRVRRGLNPTSSNIVPNASTTASSSDDKLSSRDFEHADLFKEIEPLATSGASILSSTTRADGFLLTPEGSEGLAEGETATIFLYETERAG